MPEAQLKDPRVTDMFFAILDSYIDQLGVIGFFRGGKDERRVGCRILRLVFANCLNVCQELSRRRRNARGLLKSEEAYLQSHLSCQSVCARYMCSTDWMLTGIAHHNLSIKHRFVSLVISRIYTRGCCHGGNA